MKKLLLALFAVAVVTGPAAAQVHVKGYTKADGTYVAPHVRSSPNNSVLDNYSTKGNVNPYTGQAGTQNPPSTTSYRPYSPPKSTTPCYFNCPN